MTGIVLKVSGMFIAFAVIAAATLAAVQAVLTVIGYSILIRQVMGGS